MRNVIRPILFAGAVLVPALAFGTNGTGFVALPDCSGFADNTGAELYVLKLSSVPADRSNDFIWNIGQKAEANSDGQAILNVGGDWSYGDVWAKGQGGTDVAFAYVTFPNGDVYMDNSDGASVDFGATPPQRVGNTLVAGRDAGIGMSIPGTAAQFSVQLRTGVTKSFPIRAEARPTGSGTFAGNNIAFGALAEVNPADAVPGACQIAGNLANPRDTGGRGAIIGYNVYRIPGTAATVPTRANFMTALQTDTDTDGGWVGFLDLRTFNVAAADTNPATDGTNAPSDNAPTDLAGLQNPDGRMYSGDEIMIFQDASGRAGVPRLRALELTPAAGQSYWYAVQPVIVGRIPEMNDPTVPSGQPAINSFTNNGFFAGDHRMDLDGDGDFDAVSLDTVAGSHNTPEFISPQGETENGGLDGMGLTNGGLPLLSAPMFLDGASALPALGQVSLSGTTSGNDVNVQFVTGLEKGNVLGYNVYRVSGDQRVRVNEQPILAQGNESNVYTLVDSATRARGVRSVSYMVEIVYSDGTAPTTVGPFAVSVDQQPARRRR